MPVELRETEVKCLLELEYLLKDGLINSLLLELVQVTTGFVLSARSCLPMNSTWFHMLDLDRSSLAMFALSCRVSIGAA